MKSAISSWVRRRGVASKMTPRSAGQAIVEFAVVLPLFLLLLLLAIDFGRVFYTYVAIHNASREAAAYGATVPTDTIGIRARADREANTQTQAGEEALAVSVVCTNTSGAAMACANAAGGGGSGNTVTVTVSERFIFITPFLNDLIGGGLTLTSASTSSVLVLAAGGGAAPAPCTTLPEPYFTVSVNAKEVDVDGSGSLPITGQCAIAGYNWDMGDGSDPWPPIVGMNPPAYIYPHAGTYTITLEVTNPAGTRTASQQVTVGGAPTPTPESTPSPTPRPTPTLSATVPPPVCNTGPGFTTEYTGRGEGSKAHEQAFYGNYTGQPAPASWSWNFGDGHSGDGQTASREYDEAGTYTVTLTVHSGSCVKTFTMQVVVQ